MTYTEGLARELYKGAHESALFNHATSGAAVGSAFCGVDTPAVNDSTAWMFGITSEGII